MQKLSKIVFKENVAVLVEMFGDITKARENIMYETLKDIPDDIFKAGIVNLLKNREYNSNKFPQVSEIREFSLGRKKDELQDKSEIAKNMLKNAVCKYGGYKSVTFEDPVIHAIIKQSFGGWTGICKQDIDELDNYMKFEFYKQYKAYASKGIGLIDPILKGRAELSSGIEHRQLVYVGDTEKINKWQGRLEQLESGVNGEIKRLAESKMLK